MKTEAGMDAEEILEPILYGKKNTASSEQSLGSMIGTILPFMLIVSLLMGTSIRLSILRQGSVRGEPWKRC